MDTRLTDFIAHARKKGMDHATITMLLRSSGWKEKDIVQALSEESLDREVPMPPDAGGAREAFLHLIAFAALYTTVISLAILLFSFINRLFPDPALQEYALRASADFSTIRRSMAAIIVAFPLFVLVSRLLVRELRVHPEKAVSGIRRWLTYLTLFLASAALVGDLITLVFYLLEGELSARFLLKVGVVLGVAGLSFVYYFFALRLPPDGPKAKLLHRTGFGIATAIVVLVIGWGATIVGSPATGRKQQFDQRRLDDLRTISSEVVSITYGGAVPIPRGEPVEPKQPVPPTLQAVRRLAIQRRPDIYDPETGEPYEYIVESPTEFRLCATFHFERDEEYDVFWNHPAGRHCYQFDVTEYNWR